MYHKINAILSFIRSYDNTKLYKDNSNTELRRYIRACMKKNSFYFFTRGPKIIGIVEWYRVKNCNYIITRAVQKRFLNTNPSGRIIWVENAIFIPNELNVHKYRQFCKYHKEIDKIIWWRRRRKTFKSYKI